MRRKRTWHVIGVWIVGGFLWGGGIASNVLWAQGEDRALERYQEMLEARPAEGVVLDRLWDGYAGRTEELLALYREKAQRGEIGGQMVLALILKKAGEMEEATKIVEKMLEEEGEGKNANEYAAARKFLADLYLESGELEKAEPLVMEVVPALDARDVGRKMLWMRLGEGWVRKGELEKAAKAFEQALKESGDRNLRFQLAGIWEKGGRYEEAVAQYQSVLEESQDGETRAKAYRELAALQEREGKLEAALQNLQQALDLTGPGNWMRSELQTKMIRISLRENRIEEIETVWLERVEQNPRDLGGMLQLIALYREMGDQEKELKWLDRVLELSPGRILEERRRLSLLRYKGDVNRSLELVNKMLERRNKDWEAQFLKAELLIENGQVEQAGDELWGILQEEKVEPRVVERIQQFFLEHRLHKRAEQLFQKRLVEESGTQIKEEYARFLFTVGRGEEAVQVLYSRLEGVKTEEERLDAYMSIARLFQAEERLPEAGGALQEAVKCEVENVYVAFNLYAEVLLALGRGEEAVKAWFAVAEDLRAPVEARIEADRRVYQLYQAQDQSRAQSVSVIIGQIDEKENVPGKVKSILEALREQVRVHSENRNVLMRLARWELWAGQMEEAIETVQAGAEKFPEDPEILLFLAECAASWGDIQTAMDTYGKLVELVPERRLEFGLLRGKLLLQSGEVGQAVEWLQELHRHFPGESAVCLDLAQALQQAQRWYDSLDVLRSALNLIKEPKQRGEIVGLIVQNMQRLGLAGDALTLQMDEVDRMEEESEKRRTFNDLLTFAMKSDQLDVMKQKYQEELEKQPYDYFLLMAVADIRREEGAIDEALELYRQAQYSTDNRKEALKVLVDEAAKAGDYEIASESHMRWMGLMESISAKDLLLLVEFYQKDFQMEKAEELLVRLERMGQRSAEQLLALVEFYERMGKGEDAKRIRKEVYELDERNWENSYQYALDLAAQGNFEEAIRIGESLLKRSPIVQGGEDLRLPPLNLGDPRKLQFGFLNAMRARVGNGAFPDSAVRIFRGGEGWAGEKTTHPHLQMIRELARWQRLSGGEEAVAQWVARWKEKMEEDPSGAAWAFYYANAAKPLIQTLFEIGWNQQQSPEILQAAIWFSVYFDETEILEIFLKEHPNPEYTMMVWAALNQLTTSAPDRLTLGLLERLYPDQNAAQEVIWECATALAQAGKWEKAIAFGERVFEESIARKAMVGVLLAGWMMEVGKVEEAKDVLKQSLRGPVENFTSPGIVASRAIFLLLPDADRMDYIHEREMALGERSEYFEGVLERALLYGLAGKKEMTSHLLGRLLSMRAMEVAEHFESSLDSIGLRHWNLLYTAGSHLEIWGLEWMTMDLWNQAMQDQAWLSLQGDLVLSLTRLIQVRRFVMNLEDSRGILGKLMKYAGGDFSAEYIIAVAAQLEHMQANALAFELREAALELYPDDYNLVRGFLSAGASGVADVRFARVIEKLLQKEAILPNGIERKELYDIGFDVYQRMGNPERAWALLELAARSGEGSPAMMTRYGKRLEKEGKNEDALKFFEIGMKGGDKIAQASYVALMEKLGRKSAVKKQPEPLDVRASNLADIMKEQDLRDVKRELRQRLDQGALQVFETDVLWEAMWKNYPDLIPGVRLAVMGATREPQTLAGGQSAVLRGWLQAGFDEARPPEALLNELVALCYQADGKMDAVLMETLRQVFTNNNELDEALRQLQVYMLQLHAEGYTRLTPWIFQVAFYRGDKSLAEQMVKEIVAGEGNGVMDIYQILREGFARENGNDFEKWGDLLLELSDWVLLHIPHEAASWVMKYEILKRMGRENDALAVLDRGGARRVLLSDKEVAMTFAKTLEQTGDVEQAIRFYSYVLEENSAPQKNQAQRALAYIYLNKGDFAKVRKLLKPLLWSPENEDLAIFKQYLIQSGRMDQVKLECLEFGVEEEMVINY